VRRIVVTTAATVSGVVMLLSFKSHSGSSASAAPISSGGVAADSSTTAPSSTPSSGPGAAPAGTPSGPASASASASAKASTGAAPATLSRTVTGSAVDTRYGPVEVQITVKGKTISNVSVLEYPSEEPRDQEINSYALPILNQEAMKAQSAQIDSVSGATYTSTGYIQSLQSALDQAGL
jgi:uncharacterized protein with FMN-binding domain